MRISDWSSDVCSSDLFKMSKRAGNFVTLADVVDEVGKDAVRFTMLTRKADAQMDFDFARVVEASRDNPIWYLTYAHERISRLRQKAADAGIALPDPAQARLNAHSSEGRGVGEECVSTGRFRWSARKS